MIYSFLSASTDELAYWQSPKFYPFFFFLTYNQVSFRIQPTNSDWFGTMTDSDYFIFFLSPCHRICFSWLVKQPLINWPGGTWGRIQPFSFTFPRMCLTIHCAHSSTLAVLAGRAQCAAPQPWLVTRAQLDSAANISNRCVSPLLVKGSAKCSPINRFDVALFA